MYFARCSAGFVLLKMYMCVTRVCLDDNSIMKECLVHLLMNEKAGCETMARYTTFLRWVSHRLCLLHAFSMLFSAYFMSPEMKLPPSGASKTSPSSTSPMR